MENIVRNLWTLVEIPLYATKEKNSIISVLENKDPIIETGDQNAFQPPIFLKFIDENQNSFNHKIE